MRELDPRLLRHQRGPEGEALGAPAPAPAALSLREHRPRRPRRRRLRLRHLGRDRPRGPPGDRGPQARGPARPPPAWHYAIARFSDLRLWVRHKGREVFTAPPIPWDAPEQDPKQRYRTFRDRGSRRSRRATSTPAADPGPESTRAGPGRGDPDAGPPRSPVGLGLLALAPPWRRRPGPRTGREAGAGANHWKDGGLGLPDRARRRAGRRPLTLREEPALKWTNPLRRADDGAVFVWTDRGRPEVAASFYRYKADGRPFEDHEFVSLSAVARCRPAATARSSGPSPAGARPPRADPRRAQAGGHRPRAAPPDEGPGPRVPGHVQQPARPLRDPPADPADLPLRDRGEAARRPRRRPVRLRPHHRPRGPARDRGPARARGGPMAWHYSLRPDVDGQPAGPPQGPRGLVRRVGQRLPGPDQAVHGPAAGPRTPDRPHPIRDQRRGRPSTLPASMPSPSLALAAAGPRPGAREDAGARRAGCRS